jgi:POTRA domain-containing FtsQ-type protein
VSQQVRARRTSPKAAQAVPHRRGLRQQSHTGGRRGTWRVVSLMLFLILGGILIFLFTNDLFVVRGAEIGGVRYVPVDEVFSDSGVSGQRIVMINPLTVQKKLELSPSIETAEVLLQWPANVIIRVREREPAIVWEQGGKSYWVDLNGHLMIERRNLPNLLHVINEGEAIPFQCPGPSCEDQDAITIDPEVVRGAQHLKTLRSNIDVLYYDPVRGLSYQDGRGWRAYFGVGATMDTKLIVYETLVATLEARGVHPIYIDVSNPDAPYYQLVQ